MLSDGMKKLFAEEREWEAEGLYQGKKATLYDIWASFHSFSEEEISDSAGGTPFDDLWNELSRLREKYGTHATLDEVEQKEKDGSRT